MTLATIFTVKNEHLQRLNADEAVWFFADLLRAETRRLGLPVTSVNISSRTNVPDGGVDAAIDAEVPQDSGLAKTGRTVFQVKAGDFKPWQPAAIRVELFGDGDPALKDSLGAPVRACMDAGRYLNHPAQPLPSYRIGGKILVRRCEYDAWARQFRIQRPAMNIDAVVEDVLKDLR